MDDSEQLRVSIEGMFEPVLDGGLDASRLGPVRRELAAAHASLMAERGKSLGFYDAPLRSDVVKQMSAEVRRLRALADDLLVLGIGGSSLGGQALIQGLAHTTDGAAKVHFVDNVDPDTFGTLLGKLDPSRTAVAVITKTGGTVETLAQYLIVRRWLRVSLGQGEARSRMSFVTDPGRGFLRELAQTEGIRAFEIPENVGGRYSVLTPVGLLPAAFAGIDIHTLLAGARAMVERVVDDDMQRNPAAQFSAGALLAARELGRSSLVMMPYSDALRMATSWFVQLWAESLGKRLSRGGQVVHAGQTPIPAVGATDQHAQVQLFLEGPRDKAVVLVTVEQFRRQLTIPDELPEREDVVYLHGRELAELLHAERRATRAALLDAGVPVVDVYLPELSEAHLGALLVVLEAACALTGTVMGVDPFNQPGVEAGKRMTMGLLERPGYEADAERVRHREARQRSDEET